MSFGVFSSRFGSEPEIPLEMSVEHEHPDNFASAGRSLNGQTPSITPPGGPDLQDNPAIRQAQVDLTNLQLKLKQMPWSVIVPAGVIVVAAAAMVWFLNGKKLPEIPI